MKWFKHQTRSHNDEKLEEVVHQFGLEGYGFWWLLLELIGQEMDASDKCELSYPLKVWARKLRCTPRKTSTIFSIFSEKTLILMSYDNTNGVGKIKISVPNLLKFRDEYSKKSVQTPDKLPTDSGPKNKIQKEIKNKEKEKTCAEQDSSPPFSFILHDGSFKIITEEKIQEWEELYDGIDVRKELKILAEWCENNPRKRKTDGGAMKFVCSWLNRAEKDHKGKTTVAADGLFDRELERARWTSAK